MNILGSFPTPLASMIAPSALINMHGYTIGHFDHQGSHQSALKHGVAHNVLNLSKMKTKMEILNALILTLTHLTWVSSAQNVRHNF